MPLPGRHPEALNPMRPAIRSLAATEAEARQESLAEILWDCVDGGASVNFVKPFTLDDARAFWRRTLPAVAEGRIVLLVAELGGRIVGTVQLTPAGQPNQRHRADVNKLLVLRSARRQGIARALMHAAEAAARAAGRRLITLDTQHQSAAEALYQDLGYTRFGIVPRFSLANDGSDRLDPCAFFYKELA